MCSIRKSPLLLGDKISIESSTNRLLNDEKQLIINNGNKLPFGVLFNVLNFIKSLLCLIRIKTDIVCQRTTWRSLFVYEKINLLDCISLVDYYNKVLLTNISYSKYDNDFYLKQLIHSYSQIENEIDYVTNGYIDSREISSNYLLSQEVICTILYDCETDMDNIEQMFSNISKELQSCFNSSSISKRIQRSLQKNLGILSTELLTHLDPIKLVLESKRLIVSSNKISSINVRIQMLGIRQKNMRNMVLERILLLQSVLISGRKPSHLAIQSHKVDLDNRKRSVMSIDSGFQISEPSKTDSLYESDLNDIEDEDDVIPFYDEEYERIIVDDFDRDEDIQQQSLNKNAHVTTEYTETLRQCTFEFEFSNYLSHLISSKKLTNEVDILQEIEHFVWEQEYKGFNKQKNNSASRVIVNHWRICNNKLDQNTNNNADGESDDDTSSISINCPSITSSSSSFIETQRQLTDSLAQDNYKHGNSYTRFSSPYVTTINTEMVNREYSSPNSITFNNTNTTSNNTSCCCDCIVRYKTSCFDDVYGGSTEMQQSISSDKDKYDSRDLLFLSNLSMTLRLVKLFIKLEYESYNSSIRTLHSLSKEIGSTFMNLSELLAEMTLLDESDTKAFDRAKRKPARVSNNTLCDTLKDLAEEIFVDTLQDISEEQLQRQENLDVEMLELSIIFNSLHYLLVSTESQVSLLETLLSLIAQNNECCDNDTFADNNMLTCIIHNSRLCVVKKRIEVANQILGNMDVLLHDNYCSDDDSQLKLLNDFNYLYKEYSVLLHRTVSLNLECLDSQVFSNSPLSMISMSLSSSMSSEQENHNDEEDSNAECATKYNALHKEFHKNDMLVFNDLLPNELLIKIDLPSKVNQNGTDENLIREYNLIFEESKKRLIQTVKALKEYPCYLPLCQLINYTPRSGDEQTQEKVSDFERDLLILRRITAICAVNIVDLHNLGSKFVQENKTDAAVSSPDIATAFQDFSVSTKILHFTSCWQHIDTECHRILRCTNLLHRINRDVTAAYASMIALYALLLAGLLKAYKDCKKQQVQQTGPNGVDLAQYTKNSGKATSLLLTLKCYKLRLLRWLDEVKLCSDVIREKRITHRRYRYYVDISKYLGENLSVLQQLSDNIIKDQFSKDKRSIKNIKKLHKILRYLSRKISSTSTTNMASSNVSPKVDISVLDICKKYSTQNSPVDIVNPLRKKSNNSYERAASSTLNQQNTSVYNETDEGSTDTISNAEKVHEDLQKFQETFSESFIWCEKEMMEESNQFREEHVVSAEIDIGDEFSQTKDYEIEIKLPELKYQDSAEYLSRPTSIVKDLSMPIDKPQISEHSYNKILEYALQNILQQNSIEPTPIKKLTSLDSNLQMSLTQIQQNIVDQIVQQSDQSNVDNLYETISLINSTTNDIEKSIENMITDAMSSMVSDQVLERMIVAMNEEGQEVESQSTYDLITMIQEYIIEKSTNLCSDCIINTAVIDEISEDISKYLQEEMCVKIIEDLVEEINQHDEMIVAKISRKIKTHKDTDSGVIEIDNEKMEKVKMEYINQNISVLEDNIMQMYDIEDDDTENMEDAEELPTDSIQSKLSLNEIQQWKACTATSSDVNTNIGQNWNEISQVMSEKIKWKIIKNKFSLSKDILVKSAPSLISYNYKTDHYCQINQKISHAKSLRTWWQHKTKIPLAINYDQTSGKTRSTNTNIQSFGFGQVNCSSSSSSSCKGVQRVLTPLDFGFGKVKQLVARFDGRKPNKPVCSQPELSLFHARMGSSSLSCVVNMLPDMPSIKHRQTISLTDLTHQDLIHYDTAFFDHPLLISSCRQKELNTCTVTASINDVTDDIKNQTLMLRDLQTLSTTSYSNEDDVLSDDIVWGYLEDDDIDDVFNDVTNDNDNANQNYHLENTDSAKVSLLTTTHHNISSIQSYSENFSNLTISTKNYEGYLSENNEYDKLEIINQRFTIENQNILNDAIINDTENFPIEISESIIDFDREYDSDYNIIEDNNDFKSNSINFSVVNENTVNFESLMVNEAKFGKQTKLTNNELHKDYYSDNNFDANDVILFLVLLFIAIMVVFMATFVLLGNYQLTFDFFKQTRVPGGLPT